MVDAEIKKISKKGLKKQRVLTSLIKEYKLKKFGTEKTKNIL